MCRSAAEYPPNGKRCAGANHLAMKPAEYDAWRLKRNARERELYRIRNARKLVENSTLDDETITVEPEVITLPPKLSAKEKASHLSVISKDISRLGDSQTGDLDTYISTEDERERLALILTEEQGDLAYIPVKKEDVGFHADSTNQVARLILEDGRVGYFKYYEGGHVWDDGGTVPDYSYTYLGAALNEVTAYKLTQVLGEGYDDLVPETVFTEHNGRLGTLQLEATGVIGESDDTYWDPGTEIDVEGWRKAAIFDIIAGSRDRHSTNFFVQPENKYKPVLIDNGFSFPSENDLFYNGVDVCAVVLERLTDTLKLTVAEKQNLRDLRDSPDLRGMRKFLSQDQASAMKRRITMVLKHGIHDPS